MVCIDGILLSLEAIYVLRACNVTSPMIDCDDEILTNFSPRQLTPGPQRLVPDLTGMHKDQCFKMIAWLQRRRCTKYSINNLCLF